MSEIAYALNGRLLMVAHTKNNVSARDWAAHIGDIADHARDNWASGAAPRILVFTDGGGPDAIQRKALFDAVPQLRSARGAVLSRSVLVRGIATAFSWFTAGFKVFSPSALQDALAWLELDKAEKDTALSAIAQLRRELGEERARSIPGGI